MIFLDCDDVQLISRFSETRRHPLAEDRPVSDGLALERQMLAPLKMIADLHIDTSAISATDLRLWQLEPNRRADKVLFRQDRLQ